MSDLCRAVQVFKPMNLLSIKIKLLVLLHMHCSRLMPNLLVAVGQFQLRLLHHHSHSKPKITPQVMPHSAPITQGLPAQDLWILAMYVEWNNVNPGSGAYKLKLRYANGSSSNRQCNVTVNGLSAGSVPFAPTGGWSTWGEATINTINLTGNTNTIRIQIASGFSGPNLDRISLEPVAGSSTSYRYLRATISGSSIGVPELYWKTVTTTYPRSAITSNTAANGQGERVVGGTGHYNDHLAFNKADACSGSDHLWIGDATPHTVTLDLGSTTIAPTQFVFSKCSFSNITALKLEGSNDGSNFSLIKNFTSLSNGNFPGDVGTFNLTGGSRETGELNESEDLFKVSVYPNPSSEFINISLDNIDQADVTILDLTGRELKTFSVKENYRLSMPRGMYLMRINHSEGSMVKKIIFQ